MTLKEFVKQNLTASQYETLSKSLHCTKNRLTKIISTPNLMKANEIHILGKLLNVNNTDLINDYNCGIDVMTVKEMWVITNQQVNEHGQV